MPSPELPDSGFPTARDDDEYFSDHIDSSPINTDPNAPLTSTPVVRNGNGRRSLREHFRSYDESEGKKSRIPIPAASNPAHKELSDAVRTIAKMSKEMFDLKLENKENHNLTSDLLQENVELKKEDDIKVKEEPLDSYERSSAGKNVVVATATIKTKTEVHSTETQTEVDPDEELLAQEQKFNDVIRDLEDQVEEAAAEKKEIETKLAAAESQYKLLEEKLRSDEEKSNKQKQHSKNLEHRIQLLRKDNDALRNQEKQLMDDISDVGFQKDEAESKLDFAERELQKKDLELQSIHEKINEVKMEKVELEKKLEEAQADVAKKEEAAEEQKIIHEELMAKLEAEFKKEKESMKERIEEAMVHEDEAELTRKENERLVTLSTELTSRNVDAETKVMELTAMVKALEKKLEGTQQRLDAEKQLVSKTQNEVKSLNSVVKQKDSLIIDHHSLRELNEKLVAELDFLRKRNGEKVDSEDVARMEKKVDEMKKDTEELEKKLDEAKKKQEDLKEKVLELEGEAEDAKRTCTRLRSEVSRKEKNIEELTSVAVKNDNVIEELRTAHLQVVDEYQDFKTNAELQYTTEVSQKEQMIDHLRQRILNLERDAYKEPTEVEEKSVQVFMEDVHLRVENEHLKKQYDAKSEEADTLKKQLREMSRKGDFLDPKDLTRKMEKVVTALRNYCLRADEALLNDIGSLIASLIEDLNSHLTSPVASVSPVDTSRFWQSLTTRVTTNEKEWKGRLEKSRESYERLLAISKGFDNDLKENQKIVQNLTEDLNDKGRQYNSLTNELVQIQEELKECKRERENLINAVRKIPGLHIELEKAYGLNTELEEQLQAVKEELLEYAKNSRELHAQRLELSREKELLEREKLKMKDSWEEHIYFLEEELTKKTDELASLNTKLDRSQQDVDRLNKQIAKLQEDLRVAVQKKKYERETTEQLKRTVEKLQENEYILKKRNGERQASLNLARERMASVVNYLAQLGDRTPTNVADSIRELQKFMKNDIHHDTNVPKEGRQILGTMNKK